MYMSISNPVEPLQNGLHWDRANTYYVLYSKVPFVQE